MPVSVEEAFAFYGDAGNLEQITPPWLRFRILDPRPGRAVGRRAPGVLAASCTASRSGGRPRSASGSRRTASSTSRSAARTALWEHTHTFEPVEGGTLLTDRVRYAIPYGPLGMLAHVAFVRRDLRRIFDYRRDAVAALLGDGAATLSRPCPPSRLIALPAVAAALAAAVAAAGSPAGEPARAADEPNPCTGPHAARLRCPDLQMGVPADLYARSLRGAHGPARHEQPQEPGRGTGDAARNAHREAHDAGPPAHLPPRRLAPDRATPGRGSSSSTSPVRARTGSGPMPRASSCGRSTRPATASGSCGRGRRWSTACAT